MGVYVDLHSYNYEKLIKGIKNHVGAVGIEETEVIVKILSAHGSVVWDRYVLLNDEHWEDNNSYYNVGTVLDYYFKVEDTFGEVFCTMGNNFEHEELVSHSENVYDTLYDLGIDMYDLEEEDDE